MQSLQSVVILLLVLIEIEGQELITSTCGRRLDNQNALIVHGFQTTHWPWHAAIYHDRDYKCGGTLINENSILTAAHCISDNNVSIMPSRVSVSLGKLNLAVNESSAQSFEVDQIVPHPEYSSIDMINDIAIIRLSSDATFNNYVRPICLWDSNKLELSQVVGRQGTIIGWGVTETGQVSNVLQEALMPVVSSIKCLKSDRDFFGRYLTETNYCAGFQNGTRACYGDSGGSMTFEENGIYHIRGIVSLGPNKRDKRTGEVSCDTKQFAVFTDAAQYLSWINEVMMRKTTRSGRRCEKTVKCSDTYVHADTYFVCDVHYNLEQSEEDCDILFTEFSESTVSWLKVIQTSTALPNLSDATNKFEKLIALQISTSNLKKVERANFAAFGNLQILFLDGNEISEIGADTFDDLMSLTQLNLEKNQLKEIDRDLFKNLHSLKWLDIYQNRLESLPEDVFRNNRQLLKVKINGNQLKEFRPDVFKELGNLRELYLYNNLIETLTDDLFRNNRNLDKLSISENKMQYINPNLLKGLSNLAWLDINANQLGWLRGDLLSELSNLQEVYFYKIGLESIPEGLFQNNPKMRRIALHDNKIAILHQNLLKDLRNLEHFNANDNLIETLPEHLFRDNPNLGTIYLENNKINVLPSAIFMELINLKNLYLKNNLVELLPEGLFRNQQKLEKISLLNNRIKTIETDFQNLPNLLSIEFGGNVCINEYCDIKTFCGTSSIGKMQRKIWGNC